MTRNDYLYALIVGVVLTIAGFLLIFYNVTIGESLATNWLVKRGGADTATYNIILSGYINSFLAAGSILLAFGIGFIAFTWFKLRSI